MGSGSDADYDDVISLMASVVRQANGYISGRLNEAGVGNLAPAHGDVLDVLYSEGEAKMCTIAEKTGRDPSTITALVHKLQKFGYVEMRRDEKDRRVSKARLTDSGMQLRPLVEGISGELSEIQRSVLSEQERKNLKDMLLRMQDAYRDKEKSK